MIDEKLQLYINKIFEQLRTICQIGTIVDVDYNQAKVKVKFENDVISAWLPWAENIVDTTRTWTPPKNDAQAIVLFANGNVNRGVVISYLHQNKFPQIAQDGDLHKVLFANGSSVEVDEKNNTMNIKCIGALTIHATGNMVLKSDSDIAIQAPHVGVND